MQNYYAFNDGNSNKQLLDTYLTPNRVCNLSDQKIIPNFILRMSNVICFCLLSSEMLKKTLKWVELFLYPLAICVCRFC